MSKKIVYVGLEQCDIVYHLATVLSLKSEKLIVVDDSLSHDLFKSVCKDPDAYVYEWRNIIFARDIDLWKSDEIYDADYIIEYAGMNYEQQFKDRASIKEESVNDKQVLWLVMPDYTHTGVQAATQIAASRSENDEVMYIPRNFCTNKITDKSLAIIMGITPTEIDGHIPFDVTDMAAYVALTHNGHQNIKGISATTLEAITFITSKVCKADVKAVKKMISDAKKIRR